MNLSELELTQFKTILENNQIPQDLSEAIYQNLILKGVIYSLIQDSSEKAISLLKTAAIACPDSDTRVEAANALIEISHKNPLAVEALYDLAIQDNLNLAFQLINQNSIAPPSVETKILFSLLNGNYQEFFKLDGNLEVLTGFFNNCQEIELQDRILAQATRAGLVNWSIIVSSCREDTVDGYANIINHFSTFSVNEQEQTLRQLSEKARNSSVFAQNAICELFIQYDHPLAREIAIHENYSPRDISDKVLFYFLSDQWENYEKFDFSHTLLNSIYETAPVALRRRLLAQSRYSGQITWLQNRPGTSRQRWLKDLTDMDWAGVISQLSRKNDGNSLWKLAQAAPPVWSAQIFMHLQKQNFEPEHPEDLPDYHHLLSLAMQAISTPAEIHFRGFLQTFTADVTAIAISPGGKTLAAGGSDQVIHRWQLPAGERINAPIYGPAANYRALSFSPDGQYLVCANSDHAIRIFRLEDGKLIKTLDGHVGLIRSIAIHPDNHTLYSAGFDGTIRAWRFPNGPELLKLTQSREEIFDIALSGNGQILISAGSDRLISVWDTLQNKQVRQISGHTATITNLCVAPFGQICASVSRDQTLRIWNFVSGKQLQEFSPGVHPVTSIKIHPGENFIFGANYDGLITMWNISNGSLQTQLNHHTKPITSMALNPSGDLLLSSSTDGKIALFDLSDFLLTRSPVDIAQTGQIQTLEKKILDSATPKSAHPWLAFRLALVRRKERYDIEISEPQRIQLQEFDIEIE